MSKRPREVFQEKEEKANEKINNQTTGVESTAQGEGSQAQTGLNRVEGLSASAAVRVGTSEQRTKQLRIEQQWLRVPALGEGESRHKPRIGADFQAELPNPSSFRASSTKPSEN